MTKKIILAASILAAVVMLLGTFFVLSSQAEAATRTDGTTGCVDRGWKCDIGVDGDVSCGPILACSYEN
ncbi:MAG: hypothetical protein G01um101420_244 [Parcubacteria group bacterium Gr01-1014_20]|nr:MAG: hypothetical protein G01um101420_244 [Parcubacteria group bacterium Gr01-1014_20]